MTQLKRISIRMPIILSSSRSLSRSGQGQGQDMVRSGQVNSKMGPELYNKIGFHHPPPPLTPSLNECLERRVLSKSCLYHHDGPQNDQG